MNTIGLNKLSEPIASIMKWKINDQLMALMPTRHTVKIIWIVDELPCSDNMNYYTISLSCDTDHKMMVRDGMSFQLLEDWDGIIHEEPYLPLMR